jgi:ABC-type polysaccharide/polyol phosphate export permease
MTALKEKQVFFMKIPFPRLLIMLIVGWTNMIIFLTHFFIFVLCIFFIGGTSWMPWLYVPVILFQMTLLALGVGMLLASYCLKYRDILHLWGILSQVLFWLTPITYAYRLDTPISEQWRSLISIIHHPSLHTAFDLFVQFQPLSLLIYDMRRVTLYAADLSFPSMTHIVGMTLLLLMLFCISSGIYHHRSKYFIEEY